MDKNLQNNKKGNFWDDLKKPFFVLAPMADVTDASFRRLFAKYGKPDVTWTEFVSADGLCSPGREVLLKDLMYTEAERPIVAQLFTSKPEKMYEAAKLVKELGFDGLDINMGCPDKSIEKQGAGAAMIKNPENAKEIIRAAKRGFEGPVSVKTRIGYNKNEIEKWIPALLEEDIAALTIHARTRKEMSLVPARWEHVKEVVEIRNKIAPNTKIIGNGDIDSLDKAREYIEKYGADGAMIGRGIFGNPWFFNKERDEKKIEVTVKEKLEVMLEHTKLFIELLGNTKNFALMKKHYKAYVNGWDGAKDLRVKLMECNTVEEVENVVKEYLKNI